MGVTAEYSLVESFAISSGLLFTTKGFAYNKNNIEFRMNINYLEIPVNAVYKIKVGRAKVLLNAGPYLGYALSAKLKSDNKIFGDNSDKTEQTINIGSNKDTDNLKALDFGLNFGIGVEFNAFTISTQYGLGLANITPRDNLLEKNRVIGISLGYKFGGK